MLFVCIVHCRLLLLWFVDRCLRLVVLRVVCVFVVVGLACVVSCGLVVVRAWRLVIVV